MTHDKIENIEKRIYETFSNLAEIMGFSSIHGSIIGSLIVSGGSLSLQEIAKKTGYSISMISLSTDFLEVLGVVRKIKKARDRKIYIQLEGDLLESLKKVFLIRVKNGIRKTLDDFKKSKEELKKLHDVNKEYVNEALEILENQIKRLEKYIDLLSEINFP